MPDKYVVRTETLADIFENVPDDRIDDFMKELTEALHKAKKLRSETVAKLPPEMHDMFIMRWPKTITWTDDGKGIVNCYS